MWWTVYDIHASIHHHIWLSIYFLFFVWCSTSDSCFIAFLQKVQKDPIYRDPKWIIVPNLMQKNIYSCPVCSTFWMKFDTKNDRFLPKIQHFSNDTLRRKYSEKNISESYHCLFVTEKFFQWNFITKKNTLLIFNNFRQKIKNHTTLG